MNQNPGNPNASAGGPTPGNPDTGAMHNTAHGGAQGAQPGMYGPNQTAAPNGGPAMGEQGYAHAGGPGPFGPQPAAMDPRAAMGYGYAAYNPMGAQAMPPGYAPYGYPPHPGPAWAAMPPGYGAPPPQSPATDPAAAGFTAAMGDIADKSGLGMFKDFLNFDDSEFWKGALVGAAVVLLITNDELRNSLIGSAAKTAEAVKTGLAGMAGGAAVAVASEDDEEPDEEPDEAPDDETSDASGEENA